jgi:hypothetical protein
VGIEKVFFNYNSLQSKLDPVIVRFLPRKSPCMIFVVLNFSQLQKPIKSRKSSVLDVVQAHVSTAIIFFSEWNTIPSEWQQPFLDL